MTDTADKEEGGGAQRSPGWERDLLERLAFASLQEQRRARRWGIFFKFLVVAYVVARCTAAPNAKAVEIFDKASGKDAD